MVRFALTPRLAAAIDAALPVASADERRALVASTAESSIALADVQLLSRLLLRQPGLAAAGEGGAPSSASATPPTARYVHELLRGAAPLLPQLAAKPAPHPSLGPRLEALRAAQDDREYAKLVGSLAQDENSAARDAVEMTTFRSQLGVGVNLIVSMATMFTVGAYAGGTEEEPYGVRAVICGLALMLLTMAIEMALFLIGAIRVDKQVAQREAKSKARGVSDRTKLAQHSRGWSAEQAAKKAQ